MSGGELFRLFEAGGVGEVGEVITMQWWQEIRTISSCHRYAVPLMFSRNTGGVARPFRTRSPPPIILRRFAAWLSMSKVNIGSKNTYAPSKRHVTILCHATP